MDATDTPSARAREIGRLVRAQILTFGPLGPAFCLVILNSEWAHWRTVRHNTISIFRQKRHLSCRDGSTLPQSKNPKNLKIQKLKLNTPQNL